MLCRNGIYGLILALSSYFIIAPTSAFAYGETQAYVSADGTVETDSSAILENYRDTLLQQVSPTMRATLQNSKHIYNLINFYKDNPALEAVKMLLRQKIEILQTFELTKDRLLAQRNSLGDYYQRVLILINEVSGINFYGKYADEIRKSFSDMGAFIYQSNRGKVEIEAFLSEWMKSTIKSLPENRDASQKIKYQDELIPFWDTDDVEWFAQFIKEAKARNIISGYRDSAGNQTGQFGPGNQVTIAEIIKMGVISAGLNLDPAQPTSLSTREHWAQQYIRAAENRGATLVTESSLELDRPATRAEFIQLMCELFGITGDQLKTTSEITFTDVSLKSLAAPYIYWAREKGIINGDQGLNTFRPNDGIVRSEVAKILINFIKEVGQEKN
ncbi:MAG: S-layer homology domain-containing protein [Patescibacteria group bacterium]|nr:S-layer homology domain-containing protein [Patescibacteria group bacterium]